jgi:hypothetical protein
MRKAPFPEPSHSRLAGWRAFVKRVRGSEKTGHPVTLFEEFLAKEAVELGEKIGTNHAEDFRVLDLS